MQAEKRKAGRPNVELNAREKLVQSSRDLFTVLSYSKVSTRLIAKKAGVNSSMIRYYFGNKEGLFETMVRETLEPLRVKMYGLVEQSSHSSLVEVIRTYYKEMIKVPLFPRLMVQTMLLPPSDIQYQIMRSVFNEFSEPMRDVVFDKLIDSGVIKEGLNPVLCRLSYMSLMVFPFITPPSIYALNNMELTEEFLMELFEHNIEIMKNGFLVVEEA
ncbi:TetR/AcrR family transcriptional regulator [Vibrio marisflavi]|nr:TetR/AcrR family transcriptional regulator [Vibrio marisflavi]